MQKLVDSDLFTIRDQVREHLYGGIIPFWMTRAIDAQHGGYLTSFDADGNPRLEDTNKYIVTQTRMIWGSAVFSELCPDLPEYLENARQGVDFFINHFWDPENGGWAWKVQRDGTLLDNGKLVYGQSFAIYSLAQYTISTGDPRGLDYASRTFDLLQKYCADTARGGYYENLEPDWRVSGPGFEAGDRKSLDIHMHLLEAFTTLADASGLEIHRRKLAEVAALILARMLDHTNGCGYNQFDLEFHPIPPIAIRRTWNAERKGESVADLVDTTSYGHNLELGWLLAKAAATLGASENQFAGIVGRLGDHALRFGFDWELGGVYRDGPHDGPALVQDKEFWQNSEALVGLLECYLQTGSERFLQAFKLNWNFARQHMIHPQLGEWRTLVSRTGQPIWADLGNPWKACYHTGRAMLVTLRRLDEILG